MKLWLDDWRRPVGQGWVWVKDFDECVSMMESQVPEVVSLDHDLGPGPTGYDVLLWCERNGVWPNTILIHTANPVGHANMVRCIQASGLYVGNPSQNRYIQEAADGKDQ